MTTIYKAGGVKSDTPVGFRIASADVTSTTRTVLNDGNGQPFVVSAGKTFYIGTIVASSHYGMGGVWLYYDDDGAGTNEKLICVVPYVWFDSNVKGPGSQYTIECVIPVPSGKHLTGKSAYSAILQAVFVCGQEI